MLGMHYINASCAAETITTANLTMLKDQKIVSVQIADMSVITDSINPLLLWVTIVDTYFYVCITAIGDDS